MGNFPQGIFIKHFLTMLECISSQKYIELLLTLKAVIVHIRQSLYSNAEGNANSNPNTNAELLML